MPLQPGRSPGSLPLHPLDDFYGQARHPLPRVQPVEPNALPEPFRTLLVHHETMTRTLEAFYGQRLQLRVLDRRQEGEIYVRHIVLCADGPAGEPVEFGSIRLDLSAFAPEVREAIVSEQAPVGRILADRCVVHESRPRAYFEVVADAPMAAALRVMAGETLYGRCNALIAPDRRVLAEIVEILAPARPTRSV